MILCFSFPLSTFSSCPVYSRADLKYRFSSHLTQRWRWWEQKGKQAENGDIGADLCGSNHRLSVPGRTRSLIVTRVENCWTSHLKECRGLQCGPKCMVAGDMFSPREKPVGQSLSYLLARFQSQIRSDWGKWWTNTGPACWPLSALPWCGPPKLFLIWSRGPLMEGRGLLTLCQLLEKKPKTLHFSWCFCYNSLISVVVHKIYILVRKTCLARFPSTTHHCF